MLATILLRSASEVSIWAHGTANRHIKTRVRERPIELGDAVLFDVLRRRHTLIVQTEGQVAEWVGAIDHTCDSIEAS